MGSSVEAVRRRPRSLALELVEVLGDRIRDGSLSPGDKLPTEADFMAEFGVSRTVVREAISKLQAGGLVQTRHGIGTFVIGLGEAAPFKLAPEQFATLRDVIAVLELRIGIETEAASLAAQRRNAAWRRSAATPPTCGRCAARSTRWPRRWRRGATRSGLISSSTWRSRGPRRTRISPT